MLRRWFRRLRVVLARFLVRGLGFNVYHSSSFDEASGIVMALEAFAIRSGHLTRGFHAGKRVQRDVRRVRSELGNASLVR